MGKLVFRDIKSSLGRWIAIFAIIALGAGFLAGLAYGLLFLRTRDIWAACIAHASTNLALGFYVLATGHWEFW